MNRENESLESNVTPSDVTYSLDSIIVESNSTVGKIHDLVVILISLVYISICIYIYIYIYILISGHVTN